MTLKVYKKLYGKEVFTLADVKELIGDYQQSKNAIYLLIKKGYVQRIKAGLYYRIPLEAIGKPFSADRILIAKNLEKNYFLSHHTALELHGAANSTFFDIYVSAPNSKLDFNFEGNVYKTVQTKHFFGAVKKHYGHTTVNISDKERTLLDCLRKPEYCGGLEELVKSVSGFPSLDFNKLYTYLKNFGEASLFARTGYLLDLIKEELHVKDNYLEKLKRQLSKHPYYSDPGKKTGCRYVREWNLMVPKNMQEVVKVA